MATDSKIDDIDLSGTSIKFPVIDNEGAFQSSSSSCYYCPAGGSCMLNDCVSGCNGPCLFPCDTGCMNWSCNPSWMFGGE